MISSVGTSNLNTAMMQRTGNRPPPPPEEKFKMLDTDGNSSLSTDELEVMAGEISEMTGQSISIDDLLSELDTDGNGTLEAGEMPQPNKGSFQGQPPFLDAQGNVQDSTQTIQNFNPMESLLSYLDSNTEESESRSLLDLSA